MSFPEVEVTRSLSSNLYKAGWFVVDESTRVIDANKLMESRMKQAAERTVHENKPLQEDDGFSAGLDAETVDALLAPEGGQSVEASMEKKLQLDRELEEARAELASVKAEADRMLQDASAQIEEMRINALEEAKSQGYQDGYAEGMNQVEGLKEEYISKKQALEADYHQRIEELEPEFIKNLTEIYEHIFKVDLSTYSQLVSTLLIDAMQKMDSAHHYIVHVSRQDYPQVYEDRERILEETGTLADRLEIISDMTLSDSQCMIETEDGIYDCSLGTELEELKRKLKLLSYRWNR